MRLYLTRCFDGLLIEPELFGEETMTILPFFALMYRFVNLILNNLTANHSYLPGRVVKRFGAIDPGKYLLPEVRGIS